MGYSKDIVNFRFEMMMIGKNLKRYIFLLVLFSLFFAPIATQAQEIKKEKKWDFVISPYVYAPTVGGDFVLNGNLAGNINQKLSVGGIIAFQASNPQWSFSTDLISTKFDTEVTMNFTGRKGTLGVNTNFLGVYVLRRASNWLEIGLGGRIIFNKLNLHVPAKLGFSERNAEYQAVMVDPLLVLRLTFLSTEKWRIVLRGDVGAFGLLDYFTYLAHANVSYRFTNWAELNLGYRYISFYHNDKEGNDEIDLHFYGPQLGLLIHL